MVARAAQYLKLLGSMVPPTVSFSLKHLKQIDKAGELSPADLLASIEPALQARALEKLCPPVSRARRGSIIGSRFGFDL